MSLSSRHKNVNAAIEMMNNAEINKSGWRWTEFMQPLKRRSNKN